MEGSTPAQQQAEAPPVVLYELGILLVAPHIDTAHINPDFLRYNEIVAPDWQIDRPVIIEPGLSVIEYVDGLMFSADSDSLMIVHRDAPLAMEKIASPSAASRYLALAPWPVAYSAVRIDLVGVMDIADQGVELRFSPLRRLSLEMSFHDTAPNVRVSVIHQLDDKSITMYIYESVADDFVNSVHFRAHIHRNVSSDLSVADRLDFIESVIKNWQADYADCVKLVSQFCRNYVQTQ